MILTLWQLCFEIRIGLALLLLDLACHGASARVSWQAGPESDLDRYEVHWAGDNYEVGSMVVPATDVSAIVSVLTAGVRYEFTLVAVNTAGMKSEASDPVTWTAPGGESDVVVSRFEVGDRVTTGANRVNVRESPGLSGEWIVTQPVDASGIIIDGFAAADGYTWAWIAWDDGALGWSGDDLLSKLPDPPPPREVVARRFVPKIGSDLRTWTRLPEYSFTVPAAPGCFASYDVEPVYAGDPEPEPEN